jgi:hypothetical protein
MNTVTIYCQYFAKAGGKKEYRHTKDINITEETIDKLNEYSGSIGIEGENSIGLKAAINTTWSESLTESTQTKRTNTTETEDSIEYYEDVGLLFRKMTYTYRIDGKTMEQIETELITTFPFKEKYFSPSDLRNEAKQDMLNRFGIEKDELILDLTLPEKKKKEPFVIWKIAHRGQRRPPNAIYAGTGVIGDAQCYVARFNYVPGKVNVDTTNKPVTLYNFWCPGFWYSRQYGEVLTTNCNYRWRPIKKGGKIPSNALGPYEINTREFYGGAIKYAWVAKCITGEPGRLTCSKKYYDFISKKSNIIAKSTILCENEELIDDQYNIPRMENIKAHASWFTEESGYILVIDDMDTLDGYHCLNNLTNDEPKELQRR